jgi:DNA-binding MarR family transcriptional regulator
MAVDISGIILESKYLNSKVFSLIRLQILSSLSVLGQDGATFRELKASLNQTDGALFSNLKVLMQMGYVKNETVRYENKSLESFVITPQGLEEWNKTKDWLKKFAQ